MLQHLLLIVCIAFAAQSKTLRIVSPQSLRDKFPDGLNIHLSPIGFQPLSGKLDGRVKLSDPKDACKKIEDLSQEGDDIFILANDEKCLESVKAKNIAASSAFAGIIKQNINNTLHDKQNNLVHIPILELQPDQYDELANYVENNPQEPLMLQIGFTNPHEKKPISVQIWFSVTQIQSYEFIFHLKDFLLSQENTLKFKPRYVLQSEKQSKNYLGCYSSGQYCPVEMSYEGKFEGSNIVEQTLRQIIFQKQSMETYWKYISYFYEHCLKKSGDPIFMNTTALKLCTQNAMILSGVDITNYKARFNQSFTGPNKEVDNNIYLEQQRQEYVRQQISKHPEVLINRRPVEMNVQAVKERVCRMQMADPTKQCIVNTGLSNWNIFFIILGLLVLFGAIIGVYKIYMHLQMKKQIKEEVDKTLEQYYRYMDTFEGQGGNINTTKNTKKQDFVDLQQEEVGQKEIQMKEV